MTKDELKADDEKREKYLLDTLAFFEKLPQEKVVEFLLGGFEGWIQLYQEHLDSSISSNKRRKSRQLQEAFLDAWKIIITKVVSPENIEHVRNTLDDLMGDYDFLARKLRRRFGSNYGLEGFKTGSTKKKSKDYEPRRLHTKFIQAQLESGVTKAAKAWDNFVHEGLKGSSVIDGEEFRIETKNSIKYVTSESEHYPVDRTFFCDVFRDRKRKRAKQILKI